MARAANKHARPTGTHKRPTQDAEYDAEYRFVDTQGCVSK